MRRMASVAFPIILLVAAIVSFSVAPGACLPAAGWDETFSAAGQSRTIRDDTGYEFALPGRIPDRIVSMAPNVTEILFALGLGERIAGVTRFCDYPREASARPKIGGLVDPNMEIVQSLSPDLIIAFRGNPVRTIAKLRRMDYPLFVLDAGNDFESMFLLINKIGLITAGAKEAGRLVENLRERVKDVARRVDEAAVKPKAVFLLQGHGLWTAGQGSFLTGLAEAAGAINAAAHLPGKWSVYKRERLTADDPDVIFILARSETAFAAARGRLEKLFLSPGLRALASGRVFHLDENAASRFGPRLVEVLEAVAGYLHPEMGAGVR